MFLKRPFYRMPALHSDALKVKRTQNALYLLSFSGCVISDVGCIRSQNEDNFLLLDRINEKCEKYCKTTTMEQGMTKNWLLAGVFDGISSTKRPEMASREVAVAFRKAGRGLQKDFSEEQADSLLQSTFRDINNKIAKAKQGGTTATVLCANHQRFKIFHLGDSRAYLVRNGQLHQLTRDQTLAQLKLEAGLYNTYSPEICKESHILTNYIGRDGGGYPMESDCIPIQPGDNILLCSDGLYELCSDVQMAHILQENISMEMQAERMVDVARKNGGTDNITCMLLRFKSMKGCDPDGRI